MTDQDFDFICALLKDRSAIVLGPGKEYLVESRLAPVVRDLKLGSISELVSQLRGSSAAALTPRVVEAMVTTETSFFRDHHPFEALRKFVIPDLIERRRAHRSLTVWCAASSTGQEPYSLAILIREHFPELVGWDLELLATDLSRDVLERARAGRYSQLEVNRGMPAALLLKYFEQNGTTWQLKPGTRDLVHFQELNLASPWPMLPRLDLILMRNVMIYFDVATKRSILARVRKVLSPDGFLLLGGAETTLNLDDSFRRVDHLKTGFYQIVN